MRPADRCPKVAVPGGFVLAPISLNPPSQDSENGAALRLQPFESRKDCIEIAKARVALHTVSRLPLASCGLRDGLSVINARSVVPHSVQPVTVTHLLGLSHVLGNLHGCGSEAPRVERTQAPPTIDSLLWRVVFETGQPKGVQHKASL
jgi:hypothetical protein